MVGKASWNMEVVGVFFSSLDKESDGVYGKMDGSKYREIPERQPVREHLRLGDKFPFLKEDICHINVRNRGTEWIH